MNVESWCAVEQSSNQSWTRKTMRHYPDAFKSTVFSQDATQPVEEEKEKVKLDLDKLAKRKHFPQKCESPFSNSNANFFSLTDKSHLK